MSRLPIRGWRVCAADPSGLMIWFDPDTELVKLYDRPESERVRDPLSDSGVCEDLEGGDRDDSIRLKQTDLFLIE